ncbi:MAG: DsbE family thiol:disulfide interchange protein [Gammaproteobacteria bacterium]|nr:DsbE family thiol:disulfide interchange protein [Gammaproteobacteria bacterium]
MKLSWRALIPLLIFVGLAGFLARGLFLNPTEVPSVLIGKPAPLFTLPQLHEPAQTFGPAEMQGKVWLLNVWASWCVSCREEHPLLVRLARSGVVPIYGLDYKDDPAAAIGLLQQQGDPYVLSVSDGNGRVGMDYGVYGVPETYVIDKQGVIRYKQIGPITEQALDKTIVPLIKELQR